MKYLVDKMLKKPKIVVIGDLMVDKYVYGSVERISPEAPVPILEKEEEEQFLGGAGLVATNLCTLGAEVDFISVVGEDEGANNAFSLLERDNLSSKYILRDKKRKTITKKRFIATSPYFQMLLRLDHESRDLLDRETESKILANVRLAISTANLVVVSDYNKGLMTKAIIDETISCARSRKIKIIVDTKKSVYEYKGSDIFVPNYKELCIALGLKPSNEDDIIIPNATKLSKMLGAILVVKRSGRGATIVDGKPPKTYPTLAHDIVNVSGAGDIFVAIVANSLCLGKNLNEAVELANKGCAKAISRRHPSVTLEDLK